MYRLSPVQRRWINRLGLAPAGTTHVPVVTAEALVARGMAAHVYGRLYRLTSTGRREYRTMTGLTVQ